MDDSNILNGTEFNEKLLEKGIGERYFNILNSNNDEIVQIDTNTGTTQNSESIKRKAIQVASELKKFNLKTSDILVICCKNRAEDLLVILGSLFLGIQVAILDPEMEYEEFNHVIDLLKPKIIFCDPRIMVNIDRSMGLDKCIVYTFKENSKFSKILEMEVTEGFRPVKINNLKSTTAIIIATEGVYKKPKLLKISHSALYVRIKLFANLLTEDSTKIISYYPLAGFPQALMIFAALEKGKVQVIPKDFVNREVCKNIHDFKIDFAVFGTNKAVELAIYHSREQDYDLSCLKHIIIGGAPTSPQMMMYISKIFDKTIVNIYGTAECGFIAGVTPEDNLLSLVKPATCGKLFPGGSVKIADFKTNEPVGLDTWGELCFNGPSLASGYISMNENENPFLDNEYFRTGDVAQYDDQGCFYIHGRLDDIFISKGKVFSAMDLEDIINTHPQINDCVAYSNVRFLLVFATVQEKNITSKDLLKWMGQKLPIQMVPNKVFILNEIPKTRNGKVKKYLLDSIIARKSIMNFD